MKKNKNAGIKSQEEMRQRIKSGEKGLMIRNRELSYDATRIYSGQSQYLVENGTEFEPICGFWKSFDKVTKQVSWEDKVKSGTSVLCWVSDNSKNEKTMPKVITRIDAESFPFISYNTGWKYATPIDPSECWGYEK